MGRHGDQRAFIGSGSSMIASAGLPRSTAQLTLLPGNSPEIVFKCSRLSHSPSAISASRWRALSLPTWALTEETSTTSKSSTGSFNLAAKTRANEIIFSEVLDPSSGISNFVWINFLLVCFRLAWTKPNLHAAPFFHLSHQETRASCTPRCHADFVRQPTGVFPETRKLLSRPSQP